MQAGRWIPRLVALVLCLCPAAGPAQRDREGLRVDARPVPVLRSVEARVRGAERLVAPARIAGLLRDLSVAEGDTVEDGAVIARVEAPELASRIDAAEARAEAAQARLVEAQADRARQQDLLDAGTIAAARFEDARRRAADAEARARAARREVDRLAARRSRGRVIAPAAGRVVDMPVAEGAALQPGAPVARIAAHPLRLRLAIPETQLGALRRREIRVPGAGSGAELIRILPDLEAGRVEAEVALPDEIARGPVGRSVPVEIVIATVDRIVVPEDYLIREADLAFVLHAEGGRTLVRLGRAVADGVVVLSGLREGDRILRP